MPKLEAYYGIHLSIAACDTICCAIEVKNEHTLQSFQPLGWNSSLSTMQDPLHEDPFFLATHEI